MIGHKISEWIPAIASLSNGRRFSLCLCVGALAALAMPPTAWWVALVPCLSAFFVAAMTAQDGKSAAWAGWAFGFGYFLCGLYWIGNALLVPGNDYKWVWPLAVAGLPAGLALFTAAAAWIAHRFSNGRTPSGFLFFCAVLTVVEFLRGHILTGFPWNLFGYAWAHTLPMAQGASLFGPYGLTLLTIIWAALPGFILMARPSRRMAAVTVLIALFSFAGLWAWGAARLSAHPTRYADDAPIIRLVQPNIPQSEKWDPDLRARNFEILVNALNENAAPDDRTIIAIWPETAISASVFAAPGAESALADAMANTGGRDSFLLTGIQITEAGIRPRYYNSLVVFDRNLGMTARYDKSHLVPFGEYIPYQDMIPLTPVASFGSFTAGGGPATIAPHQNVPPFSPLICYEIIFPGAVTHDTDRPAWIVNVTNDGWYGDSPGPYQHLAQAMFRAIEEGIPVVRSANNGISAIIDPTGRMIVRAPYNAYSSTDSLLPDANISPTLYGRFREWPLFGAILLIFGFRVMTSFIDKKR